MEKTGLLALKKKKKNPLKLIWLQKLNYPGFLHPLNRYSLHGNVAAFLFQLHAKNAAEYNWGDWDLMP